MRAVALLVFVVSFLSPVAARAQAPPLPPTPLGQVQQLHEEDGGVSETLESIVITPVPNAPFSAMLQTEWARALATGGTITVVNQRRIARDHTGRVYQERWFLSPRMASRNRR